MGRSGSAISIDDVGSEHDVIDLEPSNEEDSDDDNEVQVSRRMNNFDPDTEIHPDDTCPLLCPLCRKVNAGCVSVFDTLVGACVGCCQRKHLCTWITFACVLGIVVIPNVAFLASDKSKFEEAEEISQLLEEASFTVPNLHSTFLFEMNRHGARTAWWDDPRAYEGSSEPTEMLTPIGMR